MYDHINSYIIFVLFITSYFLFWWKLFRVRKIVLIGLKLKKTMSIKYKNPNFIQIITEWNQSTCVRYKSGWANVTWTSKVMDS